jgi:hypothetical protein
MIASSPILSPVDGYDQSLLAKFIRCFSYRLRVLYCGGIDRDFV